MLELIDNERRIISLARMRGTIARPDICGPDGVGCGWATASKLVKRLVDSGLLVPAGTKARSGRYGKTARTFTLSDSRFCALGIDVEKSTTTAVLVTLAGKPVWRDTRPTPSFAKPGDAVAFIRDTVNAVLADPALADRHIGGIGIGAPLPGGLGDVPARMYREITLKAIPAGMHGVVENNVSAYAEYIRYTEGIPDFALLSIRTGVGGGIVMANRLHRGQGYAAELGHLPTGGKRSCGCGRTGCLESEISLPALMDLYRAQGGTQVTDGRDLLRAAKKDDRAAGTAVSHAAALLTEAFRTLRAVLDLPLYILAGRFGPSGKDLAAMIKHNDPSFRGRLEYRDIGDEDFIAASAHLVHRRFLIRNNS